MDVPEQCTAVGEAAIKVAPHGSEPVVAVVHSALSTANAAMASVHKAVKTAADAAQANMTNLTENAVKASKTTTRSAKAPAEA